MAEQDTISTEFDRIVEEFDLKKWADSMGIPEGRDRAEAVAARLRVSANLVRKVLNGRSKLGKDLVHVAWLLTALAKSEAKLQRARAAAAAMRQGDKMAEAMTIPGDEALKDSRGD